MLTPHRRTLANGLRVVVVPLPHLHSVAMALSVKAGPRYESRANNGLSHLVEHMVFRGTRHHPSSFAFNASVEALGGELNGLTQRDATSVQLVVPPSAALDGLRLLGELATRPLLSGLEVERNVVLEEILDTNDGEGELDLDTIAREAQWGGHPFGMPVTGPASNVEAFTEADCRAWFERCFVGANAVLSIAGPVDPERVFAAAKTAFALMPRGRPLDDGPAPEAVPRPPIHVQQSEVAQVSALLSFPAPSEHHRDFSTLGVLRRVLDDGLASRLRQDICERRGLAYSVGASMDAYGDVAALDLEVECSPTKLLKTVRQLRSTLAALVRDGLAPGELERVKVRHRADHDFALDDAAEICAWHAASDLMGCSASYSERLDEALAVRDADVRRLARRMFDGRRALLVLVGPVEVGHVEALETLLGRPAGSTRWLGARDLRAAG